MPRRVEKETEYFLSPTDRRIMRFVREGKRVARFSVQLVSFIGGEWKPIVRYDTSHGGVHIDILHPDGSKETRELP